MTCRGWNYGFIGDGIWNHDGPTQREAPGCDRAISVLRLNLLVEVVVAVEREAHATPVASRGKRWRRGRRYQQEHQPRCAAYGRFSGFCLLQFLKLIKFRACFRGVSRPPVNSAQY